MKRGALIPLSLSLLIPIPLQSQVVTVAVGITDPTGGIMTNALTTALQDLLDVGVIPEVAHPRYVIRGVAICEPDAERCPVATSYVLALALVEPLNPVVLADLAHAADPSHPVETDSAYRTEVWDRTSEYVKIHRFSATTVGRGEHEQAIRAFVASLNARCFEKSRLLRMWTLARQEGRMEDAAVLSEELENRDWIC
jgi:hypothetical protein